MLRERVAVGLFLFPFAAWMIADGRWLYGGVITLVLAFASYEYGNLFKRGGRRPAIPVLVGGVGLLSLSRSLFGFEYSPILLAVLCMVGMTWHLVDYERGASQSGTDMALTLAGVLYIGWMGSYLISLRSLPNGLWWLLTALPTIWIADSAAYFVGMRFGRSKMAPRLSPNKTWEGYVAGVVTGAISGALLVMLWSVGSDSEPRLLAWHGFLLGAVIGAIAPLGDLGVSMIKREFKVKDTGNLLPGHGGAFDRLDSWLWAVVLGFYLVTWLVL